MRADRPDGRDGSHRRGDGDGQGGARRVDSTRPGRARAVLSWSSIARPWRRASSSRSCSGTSAVRSRAHPRRGPGSSSRPTGVRCSSTKSAISSRRSSPSSCAQSSDPRSAASADQRLLKFNVRVLTATRRDLDRRGPARSLPRRPLSSDCGCPPRATSPPRPQGRHPGPRPPLRAGARREPERDPLTSDAPLEDAPWPGNARELKNAVAASSLSATSGTRSPCPLQFSLRAPRSTASSVSRLRVRASSSSTSSSACTSSGSWLHTAATSRRPPPPRGSRGASSSVSRRGSRADGWSVCPRRRRDGAHLRVCVQCARRREDDVLGQVPERSALPRRRQAHARPRGPPSLRGASLPRVRHDDCKTWLAQVEADLPTLVFAVLDPDGHDIPMRSSGWTGRASRMRRTASGTPSIRASTWSRRWRRGSGSASTSSSALVRSRAASSFGSHRPRLHRPPRPRFPRSRGAERRVLGSSGRRVRAWWHRSPRDGVGSVLWVTGSNAAQTYNAECQDDRLHRQPARKRADSAHRGRRGVGSRAGAGVLALAVVLVHHGGRGATAVSRAQWGEHRREVLARVTCTPGAAHGSRSGQRRRGSCSPAFPTQGARARDGPPPCANGSVAVEGPGRGGRRGPPCSAWRPMDPRQVRGEVGSWRPPSFLRARSPLSEEPVV